MKKRNDKGFTLVELIVVLVILAILAAILVPALLGYIDKAREKQVTTNAEAAYVATQALATEYYGKNPNLASASKGRADYITKEEVKKLTDIDLPVGSFVIGVAYKSDDAATGGKDYCIVNQFEYTENGYTAVWDKAAGGTWTVYEEDKVQHVSATGGALLSMNAGTAP